jgi:hypothetical protein
MPKPARNTAVAKALYELLSLNEALAILAKKLSGPDAGIVRDAIQEIRRAERISSDLEVLDLELTEIERQRDID